MLVWNTTAFTVRTQSKESSCISLKCNYLPFSAWKKKYPLPLGSFLEKKTGALLGNRQHQIFVFWFMQAKRLQAFLPSVGANTHT